MDHTNVDNDRILFIGPANQEVIKGGDAMKNSVLIGYFDKIGLVVNKVDTSQWRKRSLILLPKLLISIVAARNHPIIISANTRNALLLLRVISRIGLLRRRNVNYLVVASNLPLEVESKVHLISILSKVKNIFVETELMKETLNNLGLDNVFHIPNFKDYSFAPSMIHKNDTKAYRIVFFSRVIYEKGIELAIKALGVLRKRHGVMVSLDVFGPVPSSYSSRFNLILEDNGEFVKYKGFIKPNSSETHTTLSEYDLMLFPTLYRTEGFPGAIIDAYISGLPVLASNWDNANCVVREGKTGILFELGNVEDLIEKLLWILNNPDDLIDMRRACIEEAKKYHVDNVLPKLLKKIGITINTD